MICISCKKESADNLRFCRYCGNELQPDSLNEATPLASLATQNISSVASHKSISDANLHEMNSNELMIEIIQSSNRTTHAIRAIVRFFLVQLSFTTLAYFVYFLNQFTIDVEECGPYEKCSPSSFGSFLVFVVFAVGVFISSRLAWAELERSNIKGVHSGKTLNF